MAIEQYLNSENIKASNKPIDALQLTADDQEVIASEVVEIRKFDDPALDETIELHVYDMMSNYITSEHTADHWKAFNTEDSLVQFDLYKNFDELGIKQGTYKFVLNFFRPIVGDDANPSLYIKEISADRTELKVYIGDENIKQKKKSIKTLDISDLTTSEQLSMFHTRRNELCGDNGFMNLLFLNFGRNRLAQFVNYRWLSDSRELYIKLYQPLQENYKEKQRLWIVQQVRQPYTDNVVLYRKPVESPTNAMRGPNFEIDVKWSKINETNFQNWNELLGSATATSQQIIDKMFSGSLQGVELGIDYSGFQNFVHYSSAKERVANFKYKIELLEYYDAQIKTLNSVSESNEVNANKTLYEKYKDNIVGGFDGFEKYLYQYNTGSIYTNATSGSNIGFETFVVEPWPKEGYGVTTSDKPFTANQWTLCHSTSSQAEVWYNALESSASLWDFHNDHALVKTVPEHIREDNNNSEFETFVHMIGHHYDIMYSYVKHQTDIYNRDEHHRHGISKDLLYETAKSFGWHLENGNQHERLFEYLLGTNELGSFGNINDRRIDDNLILYVPFDEGRPDFARQNFIDYGIVKGQALEAYDKPIFEEGAHGWGGKFNGTTNYLKYNKAYDFNNDDYAISFWIKDADLTNGDGGIINYNSGSDGAGWQILANAPEGTIQWKQFYTGSHGTHSFSIPSSITKQFSSSYLDPTSLEGTSTGGVSNGWHHIVFNVDRTLSGSAYVNGTFIGGTDIAVSASHDIGSEQTGDYPKPIIGAIDTDNTGTPYSNFTGSLDEIRVYNRLLSAEEITDLYTNYSQYITQSSAVSFATPKEDLTKQVWRRVVNNLPHLLKTKGTSRSVKALLSCYGIPESLLSIREYGGPKMPKSQPAGIYDQFTYALQIQSGSYVEFTHDHYKTDLYDWGFQREYLSAGDTIPDQTREWRFKPAITASMIVYTAGLVGATPVPISHIAIEYTGSYSGSADYGRVHYVHGQAAGSTTPMTASSDWVPLYDGNFWNLRYYWEATGSDSGIYNIAASTNVTYHVQVQQASDYIKGKLIHSASLSITPTYNAHNNAWSTATGAIAGYLGGQTGSTGGNTFKVNQYLNHAIGNGSTSGGTHDPAGLGTFTGSFQEYREWLENIGQDAFDKHTLNPKSYVSSISATSSFDTLVRHYTFGTNQKGYDHSATIYISSSHPNQAIQDFSDPVNDGTTSWATASNFQTPWDTVNNDHYERVEETYYIHGPSIGGKNLKSEKIRIEDNKLIHPLDRETRGEISQYDTVSNDSAKLGIYFSPQDMMNKDIFNQIGNVALDDFFGSAEDQYKELYPKLKTFAHRYWRKYENDNDINAYIRVFALFDFSFFSQLKQLIPVRTNADLGLIVEPSVLERSKVMVEAEPSREELHYEDFIPDPFPDPIMDILPLTASVDALEPMEAEPMHYTASIQDVPSMEGEPMHYTGSLNFDVHVRSDLSGSLTRSLLAVTTDVINGTNLGVYKIATGSNDGDDYTDPGIDLFRIGSGHPGATYRYIGVKYDTLNGGWITQSRHELEWSPTGSVIMEQRKSPMYSKKVFYYGPVNAASHHYRLDSFNGSRMLDSRTSYNHTSGSGFESVNTSGVASQQAASTARFEEITHNNWTGQAMLFDCQGPQLSATHNRGGTRIRLQDDIMLPKSDNTGKFSISVVLKPASGSGTGDIAFLGRGDATNPGFWINDQGVLVARSEDATYWNTLGTSTAEWNSRAKDGQAWPVTNDAARDTNHLAYTYDGTDPENAVMKFYLNGRLQNTVTKDVTGDVGLGRWRIRHIGMGYKSSANTYAYSGSMAQLQIFDDYCLSSQEVKTLNKYPDMQANRDWGDEIGRKGREFMTRARRSNGYGTFTDLGEFATSHSLQPADYRDDPLDSSYYEGSKITAPGINEPSPDDVKGEEVVKITLRNRYSLVYKKDLPAGGNLDVR